jgi:hypothetical protein
MMTFCALSSLVKELIPTPYQMLAVVFNESLNTTNLGFAETSARLQCHRIKPELGNPIFAANVDVLRFVAVTRIKEESIWSNSQHRGHAGTIVPT